MTKAEFKRRVDLVSGKWAQVKEYGEREPDRLNPCHLLLLETEYDSLVAALWKDLVAKD